MAARKTYQLGHITAINRVKCQINQLLQPPSPHTKKRTIQQIKRSASVN